MKSITKYIIKDKHGNVVESNGFSVVGQVTTDVEEDFGELEVIPTYKDGTLNLLFRNIKGNGIFDVEQTTISTEDGGENVWTIIMDSGREYTLTILNGKRGNGIKSIEESPSEDDGGINTITLKTDDDGDGDGTQIHIKNGRRGNGIAGIDKIASSAEDGGTNTWRITFTDGGHSDISVLNGKQGSKGDSLQPLEGELVIAHELGDDDTKVLDQAIVSEMLTKISDATIGDMTAATRPTLTDNLGYVKYSDGSIGGTGSSSQGFHSDAISVQGGSLVVFFTYASATIATISRYDSVGETFTPLVKGDSTGNSMKYYQFFATEDMQLVFSGFKSKYSDSWLKVVTLGESVMKYIMDVKAGKADVAELESKIGKIYDGSIETLSLTKNTGYINKNGNISSTTNTSFFYTDPVGVTAGTTLKVKIAAAGGFAAISKHDDGEYTPLVLGSSGTSLGEITYHVTEDMEVVFSGYTSKWSETEALAINVNSGLVKELLDFIDTSNPDSGINKAIGEQLSCTKVVVDVDDNGGYINKNGNAAGSSATGFRTSTIQLQAGDIIVYNGSAAAGFAAIAKYANNAYTPLVLGNTAALEMGTYVYRAEETMQVVLSGYSSKLSDSTAKILRNFQGNATYYMEALIDEQLRPVVEKMSSVSLLSAYNNIVAIGDSLTYCQVYTANDASRQAYNPWPKIVQKKCGMDNYSIFAQSGDDAIEAWRHFKSQYAVQQGASLCVIYLGTNGAVVGDTLDTDAPAADVDNYETAWANTYTGCYCKIIQKFLNLGAKVLLVLPRAGGTGSQPDKAPEGWTLDDTRESIKLIADRFGCAWMDAAELYSADDIYHLYPRGSGSNSLHYNDFGYAYFADKFIEKFGNLSRAMLLRLLPPTATTE